MDTKDRLCVHVRLRMDNVSAVAYLHRLEGYPFSGPLQLGASPMAMDSEMQHISQCRTSIGDSECVSRVPPFPRLEQLEALPSNIPLVNAGSRSLCIRSICRSPKPSVNPVLQLEAGSDGTSHGRPLAELGSRKTLRIPPLCLKMRCLAKLTEERGELILVTPVWPTQAWYPSLLEMSVSLPILLPWDPKLLQGSQGHTLW